MPLKHLHFQEKRSGDDDSGTNGGQVFMFQTL
jgi:hypothetical protein